jgi:hypothetical protein
MYNELQRLLTQHRDEINRWLSRDFESNLQLLQDIAAGEYGDNGFLVSDELYEHVSIALDDLMTMLHGSAWNGQEVPDEFWQSDFGKLVQAVQLWLEGDALITLREAAQVLRGSTEDRDLIAINGYIKRGKLTEFVDPSEPNPQKARRVRRGEVEGLKSS